MLRNSKFPILAGALILVLVIAALYGAFGSTSVCTKCGAVQQATDWQIPFTSVTVFRYTSVQSTPVSDILVRNGLVPRHDHQWSFCAGGGNGIRCAIGDGSRILPSVESSNAANIISASQQFNEIQFRDRMLLALFDPKTSDTIRQLGMLVPTNGFPDATTFHAWLGENSELFDETVALYKKR